MDIVRPLPGISLVQVDETLREIEGGCINARSTADARAYFQWVANSERQLTNVWLPADGQRFLHTDRYRTILGLGGLQPYPSDLVVLELESLLRSIQGLREEIKTLRHRWGGSGPLIVADSNLIAETEEPFEKVNWAALVGEVAATLVLPLIVIDELDGLKRTGRPAAQTAARIALRAIHQRVKTPELQCALEHEGATMQLLVDDPEHERLPDNDWEIIDRTVLLSAISERPVLLATNDGGMRTRALAAGVDLLDQLPPMRDGARARLDRGAAT